MSDLPNPDDVAAAVRAFNAADNAYRRAIGRLADLLGPPHNLVAYHDPPDGEPEVGKGRTVWTYQEHGGSVSTGVAVLVCLPGPAEE
jgi:hypothetical protein